MTDLARMIATKAISPVEVVRAHLERIATILRGKVIMENSVVDENYYGYGEFIRRFKN